jgi:hypothetical protein
LKNAPNKALKGHFWGSKYTFKRKLPRKDIGIFDRQMAKARDGEQ